MPSYDPSTTKFDRHFQGKDEAFLFDNGLVEMDCEDEEIEFECMSAAVPLSVIWSDKNNDSKVVQWDADFERLVEHRGNQIDLIGRQKMRPWNLYESFGLQWLNGYNFRQAMGDCYAHAWKNSLKASDLSTAYLNGKRPVEVYLEMLGAYARGHGQLKWGRGCNGAPMVKYGTKCGNYAASDLGKYNAGKSVSRKNFENPAFRTNALKHQSIVVYLPDSSFDTCYEVCRAGFGIWTGESRFPSSGRRDGNTGLVIARGYSSGDHATALIWAEEFGGKPYLYFENSHGKKYGTGCVSGSDGSGCWLSREAFENLRIDARYGRPFINIGEQP